MHLPSMRFPPFGLNFRAYAPTSDLSVARYIQSFSHCAPRSMAIFSPYVATSTSGTRRRFVIMPDNTQPLFDVLLGEMRETRAELRGEIAGLRSELQRSNERTTALESITKT